MLEFKSNHSIKRKCLKWNVKKVLPIMSYMKNTQLEIKPIKTGATYCIGCITRSKNHK